MMAWIDAHWTLLVASVALGVAVGTLISLIRHHRRTYYVPLTRDIVLVDRETGHRVMHLLVEEGVIRSGTLPGPCQDGDGPLSGR